MFDEGEASESHSIGNFGEELYGSWWVMERMFFFKQRQLRVELTRQKWLEKADVPLVISKRTFVNKGLSKR